MDYLKIKGGTPLKGRIEISGAKNALLPLLAATLLTEEKVTLTNTSQLADVSTLLSLLASLGCTVEDTGNKQISIQAPNDLKTLAPYEMVRKMRASVLILGPLVARFGHAEISLPGGCAIGTRPVDLHLQALEGVDQRGVNQ